MYAIFTTFCIFIMKYFRNGRSWKKTRRNLFCGKLHRLQFSESTFFVFFVVLKLFTKNNSKYTTFTIICEMGVPGRKFLKSFIVKIFTNYSFNLTYFSVLVLLRKLLTKNNLTCTMFTTLHIFEWQYRRNSRPYNEKSQRTFVENFSDYSFLLSRFFISLVVGKLFNKNNKIDGRKYL